MTQAALLGALLYVSQVCLASLPNCELVSLLILVYTLVIGKKALYPIFVFNFLEGATYGFGLWWVSYFYAWPILCLIVLAVKRFIKTDFVLWSIVLGLYGLCFGALFAVAYIPLGINFVVTYWVSGIPFDITHCIANFVLGMTLGKPIYKVLKKSQMTE